MSLRYTPKHYTTEPGEVSLKAWCVDRAELEGTTRVAIHARVLRGKYPSLRVRRVNKQVVFVKEVNHD